jgi:hypothetical protein
LSDNRFTAAELADVAGVSLSAIHKASACTEDTADLSAEKWERLSRYLCEHGEVRIACCFVSPDWDITPRAEAPADGSITDELRDSLEALAEVSTSHTGRNAPAMEAAISRVRRVVNRLDAEAALIR